MTNSAIDQAAAVDILRLRRQLYIETQAIKQALVNKGILTKEEIQESVAYVENNSPRVKNLDKEINNYETQLDDHVEFLEMYYKMKDNKLTDEERKAFADKIDADPGKYGKWLMEVMHQ